MVISYLPMQCGGMGDTIPTMLGSMGLDVTQWGVRVVGFDLTL